MSTLDETIAQQKVEDLAGGRALAEPFPGPLADAFTLAPDIAAGPYKVRRFRDGDFKLLAALENPFSDFLKAKLLGDKTRDETMLDYRSPEMLDLAYTFTEHPKSVVEMIRSGGKAAVRADAEEKFEELRMAGRFEIFKAVIEQARIYATANIEYGPAPREGEAGDANPPSPAAPLTV